MEIFIISLFLGGLLCLAGSAIYLFARVIIPVRPNPKDPDYEEWKMGRPTLEYRRIRTGFKLAGAGFVFIAASYIVNYYLPV